MRVRKFTALLALSGTACTTMRVSTEPPPVVVSSRKSIDRARLLLKDGRKVDIYQPSLNGDTIVGFTHHEQSTARQRLAVATADIVNVSLPKFSAGRTILAVTATVVGIAIIAGATASKPEPQQNSCEPTTAQQSAPQPA